MGKPEDTLNYIILIQRLEQMLQFHRLYSVHHLRLVLYTNQRSHSTDGIEFLTTFKKNSESTVRNQGKEVCRHQQKLFWKEQNVAVENAINSYSNMDCALIVIGLKEVLVLILKRKKKNQKIVSQCRILIYLK
jgi:hypothetical protein